MGQDIPPGTIGLLWRVGFHPDPVAMEGPVPPGPPDAVEKFGLLTFDAAQEILGVLHLEVHGGFQLVLKGLKLFAVALVDGTHGVGVQLFVGFEDGGVFADGAVDFVDAGAQDLAQLQVLFELQFGQEVEGVDLLLGELMRSIRPNRWMSRTGLKWRS